jgi:hypothetical protein
MSNQKANVAVFVPNGSVSTMTDEIADGKVSEAAQAALKAYRGVDSDNNVPVLEYSGDFDDAVVAAEQYAQGTDGLDILVLVTDLECDDPRRAVRTVRDSDNMFVIVPCSNQGYNRQFADELDADHEGDNNVDVVQVRDLGDPAVALKEVTPWLESQRASA